MRALRDGPLSDQGVQAAAVLAAVAAAGLAGLGLAWKGAAATLGVYVQMPFVVSGGIGGVALCGAFAALLAVHVERRASAVERLWVEAAIGAASKIAESLPTALERPVPALVRNGSVVHGAGCRTIAGKRLPPVVSWDPRLRPCRVCRPTPAGPLLNGGRR